MFAAINSTGSENTRKLEEEERTRLRNKYNETLLTLNLGPFLELRPVHDINLGFYNRALRYLVFNYTFQKSLEEIEQSMSRYRLLEYKEAIFNIARKHIEAERFVRARKLLNIARDRGFFCNMLYELEGQLEDSWHVKLSSR